MSVVILIRRLKIYVYPKFYIRRHERKDWSISLEDTLISIKYSNWIEFKLEEGKNINWYLMLIFLRHYCTFMFLRVRIQICFTRIFIQKDFSPSFKNIINTTFFPILYTQYICFAFLKLIFWHERKLVNNKIKFDK